MCPWGMSTARLHEKQPREQVGAGTGPLYEYQYTQAAVDSLLLFEDALCVYCEWHDDYVVEHGPAPGATTPPVYRFHQVKTRRIPEGPWTLNAVFGTNKQKSVKNQSPPAGQPFQYMLEHALTFGNGCDRLVFVTNNDVDDEVKELLADVKAAATVSAISNGPKKWFDRIHAVHKQAQPSLTEVMLFDVLKRFHVTPTRGNPDDGEQQLIALGVKIAQVSEVDLLSRQAVRMGRDIVDLVRSRSGVKIEPLPPGFTEADLKVNKAVVVDDLLKLISLSPEGYRILRAANDSAALRNLSRLQRYCRQNEIGPDLIEDICAYKAAWDTWLISERARIDAPDLTALYAECGGLLTAYAALPSGAQKNLAWFVPEAKNLAARYARQLKTVAPLTANEALGLIFKIAADRGQP